MATRLHDLRPNEVSLVRRGANRKRFLLAKGDEYDADIADVLSAPAAREAGLLDTIRKAGGDESIEKAFAAYARVTEAIRESFGEDGIPADVLKAMADQAAKDDSEAEDELGEDADEEDEPGDEIAKSYEVLLKRTFTADEREKLADSGAAMPNGSYPIENVADLHNAIHAVGRGKAPHADIRAHIAARAKALGATNALPADWKIEKEDEMTDTATVPVRKEDGTWDLSAVPEEQRPAFEAITKAHDEEVAELRKAKEAEASKADQAIEIAKAERDARETREYIAKSAELENLAKDDDEFGPVLKSIAQAERDGSIPEGTSAKLDAVLKAANEAVEKGALFSEAGRAGNGANGDSKLDAAVAEIRKADPTISEPAAFKKALEADPSLYEKEQV